MKITYHSHNCFEFEANNKKVLTDPFILDNPLAFANPNTLTPDYIILTHGHFDHVSDVEAIAKRTGCMVIGSVEVVRWFNYKGVKNVHGMNFGGKLQVDGFSFKYLHAHHSSSMPDGSYGGSAGSFIIDDGLKKVFMAGDTSLHGDLKVFADVYQPDVSILPIGGNFTMDIEDAVYAAGYLKTSMVIGCHYDTMPQIIIDHKKAVEQFEERGFRLELIPIGDSITI